MNAAMDLDAIRQFVPSDKTAKTYKTRVAFIMNAIPDLDAGNEPLLFVPSRWLQEGRLAEVLEVLADRSAATQRSYIAAVCKYLSALSHEHTVPSHALGGPGKPAAPPHEPPSPSVVGLQPTIDVSPSANTHKKRST